MFVTAAPRFRVLLCAFTCAALGFALAICNASAADLQDRPNVLLIYTDDQGSVDMNCYGAKDLSTPVMDSLAASGVRFTQFYSAAPVCSPSRAALMTGRYPQRAQLANNASSAHGGHGMPTGQVTIAEIFKDAGYTTGHVGKWHLGYVPEEMPGGQGFDHTFGHMGGCIDNYSHYFYWQGPNRHDLWRNGQEVWRDGEYFPQLMVDEAERFFTQHQDKPWLLYWAINAPHYPLQGTSRWREHYADLASPRREYAAFVSTADEMIGKLLQTLDKLHLRENTIVVFQSDHGHSTEERTFSGGGNAGPYRGAKFSLFEGGIRVPAIISWPGHLPAGETRDQLAVSCDWLPTLAELCRVPLPEHKIDGRSLTGLIASAQAPAAHEVFHWQSGGGRDGPQWAVRAGDWKLIGNPRDTSDKAPLGASDRLFLSNLAEDVTEMKNVAADHPDVVKRLTDLHTAWAKEVQP
ncbi:MAG: sulfatase-like hydrolase/transferase [Planctomycetales bacterium]|nr:sulfatase-like hydrolase/transferase [Planctomycetales bacterium]